MRLLLLRSVLLFLLFSAAAADMVQSSAYEVLRSHGLPIGLLPKGVREFYIDGEGRFVAMLAAACTARFESDVRYNASVSGTISRGQIAGMSGVAAQDLFLWFPVRAIRLDDPSSGIIHFDVGVVDKRYPLSLFEIPPDCSPVSSSSSSSAAAASLEDSRIAALVAESQSGELHHRLDRLHARDAVF